jgi:hypothetical protein
MTDLVADTFSSLQDEYYPGSKQKRRESKEVRLERRADERRAARDEEGWDAHPKFVTLTDPVTGEKRHDVEMFPIGCLAKAMGRQSNTMRTWIRRGWIPKARYATKPVVGSRGDAGRRLWTRAQIEGIAKIAAEEGLIGVWHPDVESTQFAARVRAEYRSWS